MAKRKETEELDFVCQTRNGAFKKAKDYSYGIFHTPPVMVEITRNEGFTIHLGGQKHHANVGELSDKLTELCEG